MSTPYDTTSGVIRYEQGELDHDEIIELFRNLIATGVINHLQGSYQRTAHALREAGLL